MKHVACTLLLILSIVCSQAQTKPTLDSGYRPPTYAQRLALFQSYPHSTKDVVFLGNSITAGVDWNELLQLPQARNRGISGDLTYGVLQRLDEVIEGHPAKVFILIGINDIGRNIPDSLILKNHEQMIRRIQAGSPKTKIYFQTLMPVNNTFTQHPTHYNKDEHIKAVNDGIARLVAQYHITLVALHDHFLDASGKMNADYTMDGLHLNAKGYAVWKDVLKAYL